MSQSSPLEAVIANQHSDPTFRNYEPTAAKRYAAQRTGYPQRLIDLVIHAHVSTGCCLDHLLDVGCGPGTATQQLAPYFQHATAIDPGFSMIATALASDPPVTTAAGRPVSFHVADASSLTTVAPSASIDLITCAMSAHWLDLTSFYVEAASVLKPGGSIAMWCNGSWYADPDTTPNYAAVQQLLDDFELKVLVPYELEGNRQVRELYSRLATPWSLLAESEAGTRKLSEVQSAALEKFDRSSFTRREFNRNGKREPDFIDDENPKGYLSGSLSKLDQIRSGLGTASMVTRWREAHAEQLRGGEVEDCVEAFVDRLREALNSGRGEDEEEIKSFDSVLASVLVIMKKKRLE